jgi:hypothetical protein
MLRRALARPSPMPSWISTRIRESYDYRQQSNCPRGKKTRMGSSAVDPAHPQPGATSMQIPPSGCSTVFRFSNPRSSRLARFVSRIYGCYHLSVRFLRFPAHIGAATRTSLPPPQARASFAMAKIRKFLFPNCAGTPQVAPGQMLKANPDDDRGYGSTPRSHPLIHSLLPPAFFHFCVSPAGL